MLKASYFARNVDLLSKVKDSITKIEILRIEFDNEFIRIFKKKKLKKYVDPNNFDAQIGTAISDKILNKKK